jgi:NAD-dependent DNA ligase
VNPDCSAQVRGRIEHWCSRGAMDIEGGGEVLVAQLAKSGLVHHVADLYQLKLEPVAVLERMGQRISLMPLPPANRAIYGGCCSVSAFCTSAQAWQSRLENISRHSTTSLPRARGN